MPTTEVSQARSVVIVALTKHFCDNVQSTYDKLALVVRHGWRGFEQMDNSELFIQARDTGVIKDPEVRKALNTIYG